ncbi:hypothetical protein KIL84_009493 [Mauremys mutica]|uniref:Uncharacterized protein n=1 Tax=Mauremys mutica TaxID=74926 RepID=A0A9D4ANN3_9SAUR|nr:hypothetical protein KIL84_009493 [Mauremys mutica]
MSQSCPATHPVPDTPACTPHSGTPPSQTHTAHCHRCPPTPIPTPSPKCPPQLCPLLPFSATSSYHPAWSITARSHPPPHVDNHPTITYHIRTPPPQCHTHSSRKLGSDAFCKQSGYLIMGISQPWGCVSRQPPPGVEGDRMGFPAPLARPAGKSAKNALCQIGGEVEKPPNRRLGVSG